MPLDAELTPTVGKYFNAMTHRPFIFSVDKCHVVTASIRVNDVADKNSTTEMLSRKCPGLSFFTSQDRGETYLHIPGLNLPENDDLLAEAFAREAVMQTRIKK